MLLSALPDLNLCAGERIPFSVGIDVSVRINGNWSAGTAVDKLADANTPHLTSVQTEESVREKAIVIIIFRSRRVCSSAHVFAQVSTERLVYVLLLD